MNLGISLFSFAPILIGLFFFLVGGFFFVAGLRSRGMERASRSWPTAVGRVTAATIEVKTIRFYTRTGGPRTEYRPKIEYAYNVLGVNYQGNQITYGAINVDQAGAEAMLAKYPVGAEVTVYYDPKKPETAALEHSDKGSIWIIVMGAVGVLVGLCAASFGLMLLTSASTAVK